MLIMGAEYEQMKARMQLHGGAYEVKQNEKKSNEKKPIMMPGMKRSKNTMESTSKCPVVYKYKEGCITGIRRNVTLDFFFN